jgi:hypothetical protein
MPIERGRNMSAVLEYEMDGIKYIWNGSMWYENAKFLELPTKITNRLEALVAASDQPLHAPIKESLAAAKASRTPSRRKASSVHDED